MSDVCHTCGLWAQVSWIDQKTKEPISEWKCMDLCQFMGDIEIAKGMHQMASSIRSNAAAIESFRNEMVRANGEMLQLQRQAEIRLPGHQTLRIENQ